MIWQLVLLATGIWALYYRWTRRRIHRVSKEVPFCGLPGLPVLGQAHFFAGSDEDRMKFIQRIGRIALNLGGMSSFWMVNKLYVFIADPVEAQVVLRTCLDKDDTTMKYIRTVLGNGNIFAPGVGRMDHIGNTTLRSETRIADVGAKTAMLSVIGPVTSVVCIRIVSIWRPRRKILVPVFSIKNLIGFIPVFAKQSDTMVQLLEREIGKSQFSIWKYITTYAFDAICKTSLGIDLTSQQHPDHPFLKAFDVLLHLVAERLCSPWLYWDCIYERLPRYKTFVANRDLMYRFVDELIKAKRAELAMRDKNGINYENDQDEMRTFLEMLIESSGGEKGYTELELREEVLVIILAGTDTSAIGAAFTALMLSRYPDVQEQVHQEMQEVFGNTDRPVTVQDLSGLKYLEAVIKETLRMYPAVPVIVREVFNDVKLPSGTTLVDGVGVVINFCAMHRNPAYWGDDAEVFRPERFLEGPLKHPGQFMPFSYSMRNCVGSTYAMMSMKAVLSTLVRRYRLMPPADMPPHEWTAPLRVKFDIMMKHVDNYMIRIEHRDKTH